LSKVLNSVEEPSGGRSVSGVAGSLGTKVGTSLSDSEAQHADEQKRQQNRQSQNRQNDRDAAI